MAGGLRPAGADEESERGLGVVVSRIKRFEQGLLGDVEPVGDGVFEHRIHIGAGLRLYRARLAIPHCLPLVGR